MKRKKKEAQQVMAVVRGAARSVEGAMLCAETARPRGFRHGLSDGLGLLSMSGADAHMRIEAHFVGPLGEGEEPTKKSDKQKITAKAYHAYEKQQDRVRYAKSHVYLFI